MALYEVGSDGTLIKKAGIGANSAVMDQNTNALDKFWTGTLAEYNALGTHDANTFYNITDDVGVAGYELLWTNSSPTSNFSAQTISMDLTQYELFLIIFNTRPTNRNTKFSTIVHKGDADSVLYGFDLDGNRKLRSVSITNTGFTFGSSNSGGEDANPYLIYGIKIGV